MDINAVKELIKMADKVEKKTDVLLDLIDNESSTDDDLRKAAQEIAAIKFPKNSNTFK